MKHPYTKFFKTYPWLSSSTYLPSSGLCIVEVPPTQLTANPKNWRIHSARQRSTYKAFKSKYGWLQTVLLNLTTGKLLDGHMRVDEAIKSKEKAVPVSIIAVSEEEENEILATLDSIGLLAQRNTQALESLLKATKKSSESLKTSKDDSERKLAQLRTDLQASLKQPNPQAPALKQSTTRLRRKNAPDDELEPSDSTPASTSLPEKGGETPQDGYTPSSNREAFITEVDANVLFPGLTSMGIPELLPDRLATPDQAPRRTYGGKGTPPGSDLYLCYSQTWNGEFEIGTIGFYTEDYRFTTLYADPEEFLNWIEPLPFQCLIAPDYSCFPSWPLAMNLFNVYKSRWCARLWQEAGHSVIPSIQLLDHLPFSDDITATEQYVLETIPVRAPVISLECRLPDPKDSYKLVSLIKVAVEIIKPECILLYAGEEKQKYIHGELPKYNSTAKGKTKIDYRFLPQITTANKKLRKSNG
jgi:hypothetical protein